MEEAKKLATLRVSDMTTPEIVSHIGVVDNLIRNVEEFAEYVNKHNELGGISDADKKTLLAGMEKDLLPLKNAYFSLKVEYGLRFKKRFNAPNPLVVAEKLNDLYVKYPVLKKSLQALYHERQEAMMRKESEQTVHTVKKMAKA